MSLRSAGYELVLVDEEQVPVADSRFDLLAESDEGDEVVHGWFDGFAGEVRVRGLATFAFATDAELVRAYPEAGLPASSVAHSFYATALPLIGWACDNVEAFHASGVRFAGGVVALAGPSESGKTTLAHALAGRGHAHFAEDVVAFRDGVDGIRAMPLPYTVNLRPESSEYFDGVQLPVPTPTEVHAPAGGEFPFAAVVVLDPAAPLSLERLAPPEALIALLPNAHRFKSQPPARERQMLGAYLALADEVPAYRLSYARDFESLDEVLALLEGEVGA